MCDLFNTLNQSWLFQGQLAVVGALILLSHPPDKPSSGRLDSTVDINLSSVTACQLINNGLSVHQFQTVHHKHTVQSASYTSDS